MKGYNADFLEELKSKVDIVDVISRIVHLDKRGNNYWGKCPFHHEKTASFCVNSVDQFYHCFGCHQSGDVIKFVMETESLDFWDAVKYLAEKAKIPLPQTKIDDERIRKEKEKKARISSVLHDSAKYYYSLYRSGQCKEHEEYVNKRGLTKQTVDGFGIGASKDFDGLVDYLLSKGYNYQEMVDSGAVSRSTKNQDKYFDALAGRLIIPVMDSFGTVIAFCGRIIDNRKDVGKYVNTRETAVFSKGKTLFNLNNLKKVKNEEGIDGVIIVEGHMDVISLVQGGIKNVVASMGTALTKDQARIIKRYADKVYISYDGDFAGQKASIRGLEILRDEGLEVKVVSLPDGMDPDDVIKRYGAEGYKELLKKAMPLIDFKLDVLKRTFDVKTVDGKRKFVANAVKVIKESPSATEQEDLLKTVRDLTGVTIDSLKRDLNNVETEKTESEISVPQFSEDVGDKSSVAARFILASYLFNKPYALEYDFNGIHFSLPVHKEIAEFIKENLKKGEKIKFGALYDVVADEEQAELSKIAELSGGGKRFDEAQYFTDCVKALKLSVVSKEIEMIKTAYSTEEDTEKRSKLAKELSVLMQEKSKLK